MIYFKNVPQYGDLEIEKVLFLFDNIPMIFVYRDDKKRYFLCQCVDVIDKFSWMITPVQKRLLISMVEDEISVLSAFKDSGYDIILADEVKNEIGYRKIPFKNIPLDELPDLDEKLKADEATSEDQFRILAVTACPTGIAHTYMAAEGLEKAAKAKGCFIKVETRGSGGAKNVLTAEEIKNADCIIVAADTKVPMDRFNGKKLIEVQVSDGISKADKLIEQAMSGNVPVYTASEKAEVSEKKAGGSKGHQIYMQLMNGVSHMLPFVVGGGILIALAFLIDGLCVDMTSLTAEARQSFGSITPVAATLKSIGNLAFGFMLPVLAGFIAMSIADRPGLAVGFVGGAIAANGKSGFLGALVAGFLAGYLILLLKKLFEKLPEALE